VRLRPLGSTLRLALLLALLAGCAPPGPVDSHVERERVDPVTESEAVHHALNPPPPPLLVPEEVLRVDVLQMSLADRRLIIDYWVDRLCGPAWVEVRRELVELGKDVIPHLIAVMDRTDETAARLKPRFAIDVPPEKASYDVGDLAYFTLRYIINDYSNYRGPPLPPKDREQWEEWWRENRRDLIVRGRGRSLLE